MYLARMELVPSEAGEWGSQAISETRLEGPGDSKADFKLHLCIDGLERVPQVSTVQYNVLSPQKCSIPVPSSAVGTSYMWFFQNWKPD